VHLRIQYGHDLLHGPGFDHERRDRPDDSPLFLGAAIMTAEPEAS